jgi:hypothetical protein
LSFVSPVSDDFSFKEWLSAGARPLSALGRPLLEEWESGPGWLPAARYAPSPPGSDINNRTPRSRMRRNEVFLGVRLSGPRPVMSLLNEVKAPGG